MLSPAGTLSALALGAGLLRSRRQRALQHEEIAELRARLDGVQAALAAEVEHLALQRIPAAARHLTHPRVAVPGPGQPQFIGSPSGSPSRAC